MYHMLKCTYQNFMPRWENMINHSYTHSINGLLLDSTVSTTFEYFLKGIVMQPSLLGLILCPNTLCTWTGIRNGYIEKFGRLTG